MASDTRDFRGTGAFNVNEQYATSVRYELAIEQGELKQVNLRFMNGRSELAGAQLSTAEARDVLGPNNYAAVLKALADARGPGREEPTSAVKGELRGKGLEFRQVMLPGYAPAQDENAILLDSRSRRIGDAPKSAGEGAERLTARDYVVGGAHTVQASGLAGPTMQGVASAVGVADAAKLAADAAEGKPVRPLDAATAAASVAVATGAGGPAVQGAAKATQALGAADTALRGAATVDEAAAGLGAAVGSEPRRSDIEEQARLQRLRASAVPDAVAERFLKVDDKYYFPDKKLAFVDRGTKLKAETNNLEVIKSIVTIAETRGWEALTVTGAQDFRKEVWREANLRGIDVRGYEPSDLERQELQRALEKRYGPNEIQREGRQQAPVTTTRDAATPQAAAAASRDMPVATSPAAESRAAEGAKLLVEAAGMSLSASYADDQAAARSEKKKAQQLEDKAYQQLALVSVDRARALVEGERSKLGQDPQWQSSVRFDVARYDQAQAANPQATQTAVPAESRSTFLSGRLIEAGAAPYKFDDKENPSYFVKVQTDKGERTVWGVDLERALAESKTGVKPGDQVTIENQGSKPVTVKVPVRNQDGQVVSEKSLNTHRNAWVVEKPEYFDERAEKAAAFRNGDRAKQELVAQYPDLTNAIATMRLGELFAEKLIERPEDRRRVVNSLRETLADALERGETIQAPKIKEATVRKLDKIAGEVDEVAQRAAADKAIKGTREVGARAKEDLQHVRA
jgi:Large polyvalent protein-associated domain 7